MCLPAANYSAEERFKNWIEWKTNWGSIMKNPLLNALALMAIERTLLKENNVDKIIVAFQKKSEKI